MCVAAIFTPSGTSAGVGFAIGIDTVRKVVPQLLQFGRVSRPALNIQVRRPCYLRLWCICRVVGPKRIHNPVVQKVGFYKGSKLWWWLLPPHL